MKNKIYVTKKNPNVKAVISLLKENVPMNEIVRIVNVDFKFVRAVFNTYKKEINYALTHNLKSIDLKEAVQDLKETISDKIPSDNKFYKIRYSKDVVEAVLCRDRHPVGIYKFIFSSIDPDLMFDYPTLHQRCIDFIESNIVFNEDGLPMSKLKVYTTGLNCLNSSIIKACYIKKVNLSLMHYNDNTNSYAEQIIFDEFPQGKSSIPEKLRVLFGSLQELSIHHDSLYSSFDNPDKVITIDIVTHNMKYVSKIENRTRYVFSNVEDAWKEIPILIDHIQQNRGITKQVLFMDMWDFSKPVWKECWMKSYNWKYNEKEDDKDEYKDEDINNRN